MKTYPHYLLLTPFFVLLFICSDLIISAFAGLNEHKEVINGFASVMLGAVPTGILIAPPQSRTSTRQKVVRFWGALICMLFLILFICKGYNQMYGGSDKLIWGVAYQNVIEVLLFLCLPGFLLSIGLVSRQKTVQNISVSLLSGLVFLLLLEGIGHLALKLKLIQSPSFTFRRFYISEDVATIRPFPAGDLNPIAGRSHLPGGADTFVNCVGDTLRWTYNSVGANDWERSVLNPTPNRKRIAIVGDSFLEGYMVNTADRCSSVLERKTGLEHLNFAVNGSSPIQYYLMYKGVVKAFGPDVLIVGFLPANDFEILDERTAYQRIDHPQYIPYWQGRFPEYRLQYSLANINQSIFHGTHTQGSLLTVIDSVYATLPMMDKFKADVLMHSSLLRLMEEMNAKKYYNGQFTKYEQFTEEEWHYVAYSLTKIAEEAKGKKVLILSIPTLPDLMALKQGKTNRIDPLLKNFCRQKGFSFIPLASMFLSYKDNLAELYVPCDGHWSAKGESFVAGSLLNHPVYHSLIEPL